MLTLNAPPAAEHACETATPESEPEESRIFYAVTGALGLIAIFLGLVSLTCLAAVYALTRTA